MTETDIEKRVNQDLSKLYAKRIWDSYSKLVIKDLKLPYELAVQVTDEYLYDILKTIPYEKAMQITKPSQIKAFGLGLPFEQALQITKYLQYYALKELGLPFEKALKVTEWDQYDAAKLEAFVKQEPTTSSLHKEFNSYYSSDWQKWACDSLGLQFCGSKIDISEF
jgi:hypothetical protein